MVTKEKIKYYLEKKCAFSVLFVKENQKQDQV